MATKMQGKIKAIPMKEVTEGMQVIDTFGNIANVISLLPNSDEDEKRVSVNVSIKNRKGVVIKQAAMFIDDITILVVEYETGKGGRYSHDHGGNIWIPKEVKQIPLKYSQWQAAIDNGEVDSGKEVIFEIISNGAGEKWITYAKIIPSKIKEEIPTTDSCSLGVGDGNGNLFVHGNYEAIKVLQEKLLKMEKMYTLQDVENIVTKLMHQVHVVDEDLINDHLQYWSIDFKLSPRKWLEHNLQGLKIK